jgi:hypothetical protein
MGAYKGESATFWWRAGCFPRKSCRAALPAVLESKRKYIVLAVLLIALAIPTLRPALAQTAGAGAAPAALPPDVQKSIDDFGKALDGIKTDKDKLSTTIVALDQLINPLRDYQDSAYVDQSISDLVKWITGLPDDASRPVALGKLARLLRAADVLRGKVPVSPQVPPLETGPALKDIGPKLTSLPKEESKISAAVKELDDLVAPYRKLDDAYLARIIADLTKWIHSQATDKQKDAARGRLAPFYVVIDQLDNTSVITVLSLDQELNDALNVTFSEVDRSRLLASLITLDTAANVLIRSPLVHIVKATYGDTHGRVRRGGSPRSCDATGYFRGLCEAQKSCPAIISSGAAAGTWAFWTATSDLCGFEPAQLAADGVKTVTVEYVCVNAGVNQWTDAVKKPNGPVQRIKVVSRTRIVCDPRP